MSGVACIISAVLSDYNFSYQPETRLALSLIGKFGASAAFAIVYLYAAELFPTCTRNQSVGVCALTAKIGGITTMLLDLLTIYWAPAPVLVMGLCATLAGVAAVRLPETLNSQLPDTIQEAEQIGR